MFVLVLNDMRASNVENIQPRFRADTKEQLIAFLESETVESYRDGQWGKCYRQGGPLEWYNPPWSGDDSFVDAGTEDSWASNARLDFQNSVMGLPVALI